MKKSIIALSAILLMSFDARAASIFDAMADAYQHNPTLQGQRAYLRSVDENVAIAKSGYRPSIYLNGNYTDTHAHNDVVPVNDGYRKSVAAVLSQPIFNGFSTFNSVRAADKSVEAEQSNLANVEQEILLAASTAYLDVLRDESIVNLQKNNEKLLKKRLDETRERFNVGEVTRTDVSQAEARHSAAISDRIAAEGNLAASKAVYVQIVGTSPDGLQEPTNLSDFFPKNQDEALKYAYDNNYNLKAAKSNLDAQTYTVAANNGALLPQVSFDATAARSKAESKQTKDPETNSFEWGVNMNIPLYNSGETRARIRQSKYRKWQAAENVMAAERDMISTVTSSYEYMIANESRLKSVKDQIRAYAIALDGVQQEEALGNRTVLDVLDAYQSLLNSNVEEVRARRDYYVSGMALLLSMGKLTAKDLGLNVEFYDAQKHSKDTRNKWLSLSADKNK
ncbi:MAG: TolC family outer membrane protein [Alphaproteobacteria bacterium]|nr:TolC family outer membrane protein [Alphaproteobacteria bacterium]